MELASVLTKKETVVYGWFVKSKGAPVEIAAVVDWLYGAESYSLANPNGSAAALMRTLMMKTKYEIGLRSIIRTTPVGRGNKAEYKMLPKGK